MLAEVALSTWFLVAAALFTLTTLCAIVNFGWRQPMFDQWREYEIFLGLPFPQNVLQLMNGHRPILPNLIRVAEIHWFAASQVLQIAVGSACAYASAAAFALVAWREPRLSAGARGAGVMLAVLGVLWLGNARRLLHGSESLNGYVPTLFAIVAVLLIHRASREDSGKLTAAACVACVLATFSFGLGLASFCAVLATGLVQRLSWQRLGAVVLALVATLVAYVYVLPGEAGVRDQVQVDPGALVRILAQWIAGPWKAAWLDVNGMTPLTDGFVTTQALLANSAGIALARLGGTDSICLAIGIAGICVYGACVFRLLRRGGDGVTRLESVAVGVAGYALASGVITVAARLSYLQREHPDQIYADRYLVWPSLFWSSIAVLVLGWSCSASRRTWSLTAAVILAVFAALPVALAVTQDRDAIWGALVYRQSQRTAALLRSGAFDAADFPGEDIGLDAQQREVELLRANRLAMFAAPASLRLGTRWTGSLEAADGIAAQAHWLAPVADAVSGTPAAHVEGWITQGIARVQRRGELVILSDDNSIAGFAEFSFLPNSPALLLRMPRKRGFDGYVRDYDASKSYTLAVIDLDANRASALVTLPPSPGEGSATR